MCAEGRLSKVADGELREETVLLVRVLMVNIAKLIDLLLKGQ